MPTSNKPTTPGPCVTPIPPKSSIFKPPPPPLSSHARSIPKIFPPLAVLMVISEPDFHASTRHRASFAQSYCGPPLPKALWPKTQPHDHHLHHRNHHNHRATNARQRPWPASRASELSRAKRHHHRRQFRCSLRIAVHGRRCLHRSRGVRCHTTPQERPALAHSRRCAHVLPPRR